MNLFSLACRFVDWDLSKTGYIRSGAWSLAAGLLPILLILLIREDLDQWVLYLGWAVGLIMTIGWFAFVGWRGWRLMKAFALKGDRDYDRDTRIRLSSEYRDSESATKSRQRAKHRI